MVEDIPGAEFDKNISKARTNELKFWLRCQDLKFKSSETKAESRIHSSVQFKFGKYFTYSVTFASPIRKGTQL